MVSRGADRAADRRADFLRFSLNKYYVDEIYDVVVVRPFTALLGFFARFFDPWVIDGAVNGVAATARGFSIDLARFANRQRAALRRRCFLVGALALLAYYLGQLSNMSAQGFGI